MREFQKAKPKQKLFHTTPMLLLLALFLLFFIYNIFGLMRKNAETKENKLRAAKENTDLVTQQSQINADIGELETDRGTEQVIREKFGVVKNGEGVVVVVDGADEETVTPKPKESGGIIRFFKNIFSSGDHSGSGLR